MVLSDIAKKGGRELQGIPWQNACHFLDVENSILTIRNLFRSFKYFSRKQQMSPIIITPSSRQLVQKWSTFTPCTQLYSCCDNKYADVNLTGSFLIISSSALKQQIHTTQNTSIIWCIDFLICRARRRNGTHFSYLQIWLSNGVMRRELTDQTENFTLLTDQKVHAV